MATILRLKFWLGIGLATLVGFGLLAVGLLEARQDQSTTSKLTTDYAGLQETVSGKMKGTAYARQEASLADSYAEQYEQLLASAKQSDALLERVFDDPELGSKGPLDGGRWLRVYPQMIAGLQKRLRDAVDGTGSSPLVVQTFAGGRWPDASQMHDAEKRYWIQEAVVGAVERTNEGMATDRRMPTFVSFRFERDAEQRLQKVHGSNLFSTRPFSLQFTMRYSDVPVFMEELLKDPLGFEITSVRMAPGGKAAAQRPTRSPSIDMMRRQPDEGGGAAHADDVMGRMATPSQPVRPFEPAFQPTAEPELAEPQTGQKEPLLTVTMGGYVPDYVQERPKEALSRPGTSPRRPQQQDKPEPDEAVKPVDKLRDELLKGR